MRKFVTAGIGIAALAATVGLAAPAGAATPRPAAHSVAAPGDGYQGATTKTAETGPFHRIGYIHSYKAQAIRGASVWGHWYWARYGDGPGFVYLVTNVKDTRSDGKAAGFCYYMKSPTIDVRDRCFVNTKGYGKTLKVTGEMHDWNHTSFRLQPAVGYVKSNTFYTSIVGPWLKVH